MVKHGNNRHIDMLVCVGSSILTTNQNKGKKIKHVIALYGIQGVFFNHKCTQFGRVIT